jgi:hypothetical protein
MLIMWLAFGTPVQEICLHLNVTANITTTTLPSTATSTPSGTGTVAPFTGDRSFAKLSGGLASLACIAFMTLIL